MNEGFGIVRSSAVRFWAALGLVALAGVSAFAATAAPSAFKGFGNNKDPIQIEADNMSVATPDQIVTFNGNVNVRQKDATLVAQVLKVFYDNAPAAPEQAAAPANPAAAAQGAQLRRFEASGGLRISEPDQTVTGDSGWFDIASQKAEVDGNVVLTQAKNVARGCKLLINLKTGQYTLDRCGATGRIQMLLDPNSNGAPAAPAPAKPK